jgi:hypothetical protein
LKLLKRPMDHLGKQINVSGSFWQGRMLAEERDAVSINPTPLSQQHGAKKQKVTPTGLSLFRGAALKPSSVDSSALAAADEETVDTVLDELKWWEDKDLREYSQYISEDGLLNEFFKMMWDLRESFPLHFTVFKQTACHLSHEANVEQVFSRAGLLADPNLLPSHLSTIVMVGFNKNAFKPQITVITKLPYTEISSVLVNDSVSYYTFWFIIKS